MTDPIENDSSPTARRRLTGLTIVALVLLRLAAGWHFWGEGTKKLAHTSDGAITLNPAFAAQSEAMLKQAVGPFAKFFKDKLPDNHRADKLLAVPKHLTEELAAEINSWAVDYANRRAKAAGAKKPPLEPEFPKFAPYSRWGNQILDDFEAVHNRVVRLAGMDDLKQTAAAEALAFRKRQLAEYLADEAPGISEWQHELWRLDNWEQSDEAGELPYKQERIAEKRAETTAAGREWVQQVAGIERGYQQDLQALATDADGKTDDQLEAAIVAASTNPKTASFRQMNLVITAVVIGVGICLLLGLFTRLACLAGIGFLLSIVAMQPPWVAGAAPVYYQVVEAAALLVLFATAAGRYAGLDFFLHAIFGRKPKQPRPV